MLDKAVASAGEYHGVAALRGVHGGGIVAAHTNLRLNGPHFLAAAFYQFGAISWAEGDLSILQEYKQRSIRWLDSCAEAVWEEDTPLDLSKVAICVIQRGRGQLHTRRSRSLRAVLVLRSAPFAMLTDGGIMMPGHRIPLRGEECGLEDSIEAIILPPLPPWN